MLRWQDELVAGRKQEAQAERPLPELPPREHKHVMFDENYMLVGSIPEGPAMVLAIRERRLS